MAETARASGHLRLAGRLLSLPDGTTFLDEIRLQID